MRRYYKKINRLKRKVLFLLLIFLIINNYYLIKYWIQERTNLIDPFFTQIEYFSDIVKDQLITYGIITPQPEGNDVYNRTMQSNKQVVSLVNHIDGDTSIFTLSNGSSFTARFLLIDTPETKHPTIGMEAFGIEASNRTRELLESANTIEIEYDIGQQVDKYGRSLVYVWIDGKLLQEILISEGLAKIAFVQPPNTRYLDTLEESQKKAKDNHLGIWQDSH